MSRRNLILLIIVLGLITLGVMGYMYLRPDPPETGGEYTGTNFFARFNPFGSGRPSPAPASPDPNTPEPNIPTEGEVVKAKLKKVSTMPVAGYTVFQKERLKEVKPGEEGTAKAETEFASALRYVDRVTGNIYANWADKLEGYRFTATVVPKVYEAHFGTSGDSVFMRYLKNDSKTIQTYFGLLPKELLGADKSGNNELRGAFLPENIGDMAVSPDTKQVFYYFTSGNGVVGIVFDVLANKKTQVFDSPFTEWLVSWPSSKMITLTTKASGGVAGYMYAVNPDRKDFTSILTGINGLTTLASPSGKHVLYSDSDLSLYLFDTAAKTVQSLSIRTLPEKCAWSAVSDAAYCLVPKVPESRLYPDAWYKGQVSFRDQVWKIDIASGNATLLLDPLSTVGEEIDGIKPALDQKGTYLFFVNKKDSILWELEL